MSAAVLTHACLVLVLKRERKIEHDSLYPSYTTGQTDTTGLAAVLDVCGLLNESRKRIPYYFGVVSIIPHI